jgi:hypothetical protein
MEVESFLTLERRDKKNLPQNSLLNTWLAGCARRANYFFLALLIVLLIILQISAESCKF